MTRPDAPRDDLADDKRRLRALLKRVEAARKFPTNTCPASRHLHMIAERLAKGKPYPMLDEEPEHCAETMLSVIESLWTLRTEHGWGERTTPPKDREDAAG
jgi:hypothetical protein